MLHVCFLGHLYPLRSWRNSALMLACSVLISGCFSSGSGFNSLSQSSAGSSTSSSSSAAADTTAPTVTNVTSSTADGTYAAAAVISIQVTFSEAVTVAGGVPTLQLETGTTDETASYASGSGTTTLSFDYTVQSGNSSADLDYLATNSISLVGATIKDAAGNNAVLTLPAPAAAGSLGANKAIVIATVANWVQEAYAKASNSEAGDLYGYSVSISGDTMVVGAYAEKSNQTTITNGTTSSADNSLTRPGAAYVYKRTGSNWDQEAYLKAPNVNSWDYFGYSVDIDGDTIVVGAYGESSNQTTITNGTTASADNSLVGSGAAYVFKRTGVNWAQEAYLKGPDNNMSDDFGYSVAISGDTIVVGAANEDSNQTTITNGTTASADNSNAGSGAAYVFKRTGVNWAQEAYLKAPNNDGGDRFGYSVDISVDTIVVGAWNEASNQTTITNGTTASADNTNSAAGAAYVFKRTGVNWAQEAYLKAPNSESNDSFGWSVAVSGDTVVVGAPGESSNQLTITNGTTASADNSNLMSGAAYVFKRTGVNWAQEAYLKAPNGTNAYSAEFGKAVAINSNTVVVGAYGEGSNQTTITNGTTASADTSSSNSGAAYVFKRTGVNWAQEAYLKAPNNDSGDFFGWSVAIDADTVISSSREEASNQATITNGTTASADNSNASSGAAYVFKR